MRVRISQLYHLIARFRLLSSQEATCQQCKTIPFNWIGLRHKLTVRGDVWRVITATLPLRRKLRHKTAQTIPMTKDQPHA